MTELLIVLSCIALNATLAALEVAFVSASKAGLAAQASPDDPRVRRVLRLREMPEKLHARIHESVEHAPATQQVIFRWAEGVGRRRSATVRNGRPVGALLALVDRLADKLVFQKIREATGGRLRVLVKVKRRVVDERWRTVIEKLYEEEGSTIEVET